MNHTLTAALLAATALASPARAEEAGSPAATAGKTPILVTAARQPQPPADAPGTAVTLEAAAIRTRINAVSIEDTLKYVPGLILRKRHIGDNFAPVATRTSGLGASARSLIYADGVLLSALIGNNNGNASPKWQMVAPQEVARIDVLYGPYSAAYAGNSIGGVILITTRMPEKLEADIAVLGNLQWHRQYAPVRTYGAGQLSGSLGQRFGPLAVLASATRTVSDGPPVAYVTAASAPAGTSGSVATFNRLGQPVRVLGASDIDHHVQHTLKLKLAYDLGAGVQARYTGGLFLDGSRAGVDSYLLGPAGSAVIPAAFNAGLYTRSNRHFAHALGLDGRGGRLDWQVTAARYAYARDLQASPSGALPGGGEGGAGTVQDQHGTGWDTFDASATWRAEGQDHGSLSLGGHIDRYRLQARTWTSAAWRDYAETALAAAALGQTRTAALWLQHRWRMTPTLMLTLGVRQEWWRAWGGLNKTSAAGPGVAQAARRAKGLSPKAALEWRGGGGWSARLSLGQAWRFPTVGELYGATQVGSVLANPNPGLRPERARSGELAIVRRRGGGELRLSLFGESVAGALVSQSGTVRAPQPDGSLAEAAATFVQNVGRTRARGIELVLDLRDAVPGLDLAGSVTRADAVTARNSAFPAAVGKLLPGVPCWKASAVATWRPARRLSLSAAARVSSRIYGTLDNSDVFADTYQGFDRFFVVDVRAVYRAGDHAELALGIDNLNNHRYFLFHPFPRRAVTAELRWKL